MSPNASNSEVSRRRVLTVTGGAVAVGILATGAAGAQSRATRRVMIPRAEDIPADDYEGLLLHIGEPTPGELDASTLQNCEFDDWQVDGVTYHGGELVDKTGGEIEQVPTTVYTNERSDIAPGTLWGINATVSCPKEFVGLRLEQVGAEIEEDEAETDGGGDNNGGAGAFGSGFGAVGVAAAAGIGGVLGLLRKDDE